MRCEECSKVIPDNAAYCAYCGAKAAAGGLHAPVFRFNLSGDKAVTLKDLAYALDRNWEASRVHLYTGDFANWLGSMGRGILADQTREIVRSYPDNPELGLELFMRLVSDAATADIPSARPALEPERVKFGRVPRDNYAETRITITNAAERGYLAGRVRVPPGVTWLSLSSHEFAGPRTEIMLRASTRDLPAGSQHRTRLMLTTPFDTVETTVSMYVATEWSDLLRTLLSWVFAGAATLLVMALLALLLRGLETALGGLPWAFLYMVLTGLTALVVFGSIRTEDAALAIVVSVLIGLAMLLPIGLGVLVLSFILSVIEHQTNAIALTIGETLPALALMTGAGAVLGGLVGLFNGLRRLRRTATGFLLTASLFVLLLVGLARFGPTVAFGVFRPKNQPLLDDVLIPVPYLAFAATLPAPGIVTTLTAVAPTATASPTPTPARRSVDDEVVMLWEFAQVMPAGDAASPSGVVDLATTIDPAGRLHIAYIAQSRDSQSRTTLYYAQQEGDLWQIEPVATDDELGGVSLALDSNARPSIAYIAQPDDPLQTTLYVAAWDAENAVWATEVVDGPGAVGVPAFAFNEDGLPVIVYPAGPEGGLKLARYAEPSGATPSVPEVLAGASSWEVVMLTEEAAACPALTFGQDGAPHIVYVDRVGEALHYMRYAPETSLPTPTLTDAEPSETPTPRIIDTATSRPTESSGMWFDEVISPRSRYAGCDVALAVNPRTGVRHVLFYETQAEHIYEALYVPGLAQWRFNRIDATRPPDRLMPEGEVGVPLSIALDWLGRLVITYNGPASLRFAREIGGNVLQSGVIDGPSPAQQVVLSEARQTYVVYALRGELWYATLLQAPEQETPLLATPTPGPSPTSTLTPTPTAVPVCGDGVCQPGGAEDYETCPGDCAGDGWACGNDICEETGEDESNCPMDCAGPFDDLP